jgi:tetratricopeptide (TPR) repeat protein
VRLVIRIAAAALLLCAAPAFAEGERERGMRLAQEGRCEAALADIAIARAAQPADAELARLEGECLTRLRRYGDAVTSLEAAVAAAPERAELQLALAKARFHQGDADGAARALEQAKALENDAEYQLYLGMVELAQHDAEAAAVALERARSLDAERVEPVASYYLGLARSELGDADLARAALHRVADDWTGTDWSSAASRAIDRIGASPRRRVWGSVGAGFEYDDNVVLRGRGVPQPEDISGDDDVRGVWTANLGGELWKSRDTTFGLSGSYRGTTHADLHEFDAQFPSATLWLDRELTETLRSRLRYDLGYAWLDGDPFVLTHGGLLSLAQSWPGLAGRSELVGQLFADEYFFSSADVPDFPCAGSPCGPPGRDEKEQRDRDGWGGAAGLTQHLPIPTGALALRNALLRGGYRYTGFDAQGREYSFDQHELHGGFGVTLPAAVGFDVAAGYAWRPYRHASTFPDPDDLANGVQYPLSSLRRRERTTRVEVALARGFGDYLTVSAHYRFLDNHSNVDVFDYDQHVVGVNITVGLMKEL